MNRHTYEPSKQKFSNLVHMKFVCSLYRYLLLQIKSCPVGLVELVDNLTALLALLVCVVMIECFNALYKQEPWL